MKHSKPNPTDRCACCYQWPQKFGAIGVFTPVKGGDTVFYTLCSRCARKLQRNPNDRQSLAKIEAYISDNKRQPA